jgi:hypothetical protein
MTDLGLLYDLINDLTNSENKKDLCAECDQCDTKDNLCELCVMIHQCKDCCADLNDGRRRLEGLCENCKGHFDIFDDVPNIIPDWCTYCNPIFDGNPIDNPIDNGDDLLDFLCTCAKDIFNYKKRHPEVDIIEHIEDEQNKERERKSKERERKRSKK